MEGLIVLALVVGACFLLKREEKPLFYCKEEAASEKDLADRCVMTIDESDALLEDFRNCALLPNRYIVRWLNDHAQYVNLSILAELSKMYDGKLIFERWLESFWGGFRKDINYSMLISCLISIDKDGNPNCPKLLQRYISMVGRRNVLPEPFCLVLIKDPRFGRVRNIVEEKIGERGIPESIRRQWYDLVEESAAQV